MVPGCTFRIFQKRFPQSLYYTVSVFLFFTGSGCCRADLPLTVEDILTAQDRYRVDLDFYYFNDSDHSSALGYRSNTDYFNLDVGMRYGWSLDTELSASSSWRYQEVRSQQFGQRKRKSDGDFSRFSFGVNHKFSPDNDTPALLGFVNVNWNQNDNWDEGALSGSVGVTTYRTLDPLLLSASLSYRVSQSYGNNDRHVNPGDSLIFSPSLSFAAVSSLPQSIDESIMNYAFEGSEGYIRELSVAEASEVKGELLPYFGYIAARFAWAGIRAATPHVMRYIATKGGAGALGGLGTALTAENPTVESVGGSMAIGSIAGVSTGGFGNWGAAFGAGVITGVVQVEEIKDAQGATKVEEHTPVDLSNLDLSNINIPNLAGISGVGSFYGYGSFGRYGSFSNFNSFGSFGGNVGVVTITPFP